MTKPKALKATGQMTKAELLAEIGDRLVRDDIAALVYNLRGGVAPSGVPAASVLVDPRHLAQVDQDAEGATVGPFGYYVDGNGTALRDERGQFVYPPAPALDQNRLVSE